MVVFALDASREYGQQVARHLNLELAEHEEREFEDGEHKARSLVSVRNQDVFVIHSLYGDAQHSANDKLCRLLFFIGSLHDAGAGRITAVVPYLCYGRKDRKTKPRDPVTTRYLAQLFEAVGMHRMMAMDVHNMAAFQNAFRTPTDHLEARPLFVDYFAKRLGDEPLVIVSPDEGGIKRADLFRQALSEKLKRPLPIAVMEKRRSEGQVSGDALVGDVRGCTALVLDDMISSGTTLVRAARACREHGAERVLAAATHGVFVDEADQVLNDPALDRTIVSDTVGPRALSAETVAKKLEVISTTKLVADAIACAHRGESIVALLEQ